MWARRRACVQRRPARLAGNRPSTASRIRRMTPEQFVTYCKEFVGLPYVWGGDGPDSYDCSGLVQKLLARLGMDPEGDQTAQDLYRHFKEYGAATPVLEPVVGTLLFFGKPARIGHVGIALDSLQMIEAARGGPEVTSVEIALEIGAKVAVNPISRRRDLVSALKPVGLPWDPVTREIQERRPRAASGRLRKKAGKKVRSRSSKRSRRSKRPSRHR